jgi:uncharacterized damage-inducible protein DinB
MTQSPEPQVAAFLDQLARVHERTRRVAVLIPSAEMEWAPSPGRFTLGGLVRHLAAVERWMYAETVHDRPSRYTGCGPELATADGGTLQYYDRLHGESVAEFRSLTDERMQAKCTTPAGTPITVWKWLRAHLEHEAHHRGQLYLMLALRGIQTPPLYGLTEEQLRAKSAHAEVRRPTRGHEQQA